MSVLATIAAVSLSAWQPQASFQPMRPTVPPILRVRACTLPPSAAELREELIDLLEDVSDRGINAPSEIAEDVFEVVGDLERAAPPGRWSESPHLAGKWRLRYTSSKTFAKNQGLTGYAKDIGGVLTPETFMKVETKFKRLTYEEPLELQQGSVAALFGKLANAKAVEVWHAPLYEPTSLAGSDHCARVSY